MLDNVFLPASCLPPPSAFPFHHPWTKAALVFTAAVAFPPPHTFVLTPSCPPCPPSIMKPCPPPATAPNNYFMVAKVARKGKPPKKMGFLLAADTVIRRRRPPGPRWASAVLPMHLSDVQWCLRDARTTGDLQWLGGQQFFRTWATRNMNFGHGTLCVPGSPPHEALSLPAEHADTLVLDLRRCSAGGGCASGRCDVELDRRGRPVMFPGASPP